MKSVFEKVDLFVENQVDSIKHLMYFDLPKNIIGIYFFSLDLANFQCNYYFQ